MTVILNLTNLPHHPTFVWLFWSTCINMGAVYYTDRIVLKIGSDKAPTTNLDLINHKLGL
jgi:hypothetical protein